MPGAVGKPREPRAVTAPSRRCACAFSLLLLIGAAGAATLPPLVDGDHVTSAWHVVTLPQQGSKPVTRFSAERVDGRLALRVDADHSYGNLVFDTPPGPLPQRLRRSWRMQVPNPAADLHQRAGDDAAVKVCVAFDLPLDSVPFAERQLLRLARASSGQPLPAATLCYVWAGAEPRGALIDNAFTHRVRYIVLRNAGDGIAAWLDESRDLAVDFLRAFGDESPSAATKVPPLLAVIVGGDADNTGLHTVAHLSALRFEP